MSNSANMNMNLRTFVAGAAALALLAALPSRALAQTARFDANPKEKSKVRIEGTSNIHDWQVEGSIIGGYIQTGANFPTEPGQAATPGKIEAKVEAFIPVRSLKSIEKDGKPYSDKMDEVMMEKLKFPAMLRINFRCTDLTLKEPPKTKDAPYVLESKGELIVAGVTNKITMPVNVLPLGEKRLKIYGNTAVKMTDFGIQPPAPAIALGIIKTGDEVKLFFEWMVIQKPPPAAAQ